MVCMNPTVPELLVIDDRFGILLLFEILAVMCDAVFIVACRSLHHCRFFDGDILILAQLQKTQLPHAAEGRPSDLPASCQ